MRMGEWRTLEVNHLLSSAQNVQSCKDNQYLGTPNVYTPGERNRDNPEVDLSSSKMYGYRIMPSNAQSIVKDSVDSE